MSLLNIMPFDKVFFVDNPPEITKV